MSDISFRNSGINVNTDHISANSKRSSPTGQNRPVDEVPQTSVSAFRREVPRSENSESVEVDGKRYFLNAPRGTYLNILV